MYEIKFNSSSHDCECCGWIDFKDAEVYFDGQLIHSFSYDGHFGGGNWNGDEWFVYREILRGLGIKLNISADLVKNPSGNTEPFDYLEHDPPFYENYVCGYSEDSVSCFSPSQALNIQLSVERVTEWYSNYKGEKDLLVVDTPYEVSFEANGVNHTCSISEFSDVYKEIFSKLAEFEVSHKHKSFNDYDSSYEYEGEDYDD